MLCSLSACPIKINVRLMHVNHDDAVILKMVVFQAIKIFLQYSRKNFKEMPVLLRCCCNFSLDWWNECSNVGKKKDGYSFDSEL